MNNSDLSAARPRSSYASDRLLAFRDVACHVDCANIAFSNRGGLNTNPLLDSVGVRPLIDQYVYCLTTTFSFREEPGKPCKDARRGRCHPLEAGFWPLWMTQLPRNCSHKSQVTSPSLCRRETSSHLRLRSIATGTYKTKNTRKPARLTIL